MALNRSLTVVITLLTWTVVSGQELCTSNSECPSDHICVTENNVTDPSSAVQVCSPPLSIRCINCTIYNRKNITNCSTNLHECGECLENYIEARTYEYDQVADCVLVSTSPDYMNVLLIFAIILPLAGLLVVAFSLCVGKLYHRRIVKKARSAAQLMDEDYLNQQL